jgi:hypothetical protein
VLLLLLCPTALHAQDIAPAPADTPEAGLMHSADGERPAPVETSAVGAAGDGGAVEGAPTVEWRLAPIVYDGDVSYEARMTRNENQPDTLEHLLIGNLRGRSYVWQPWFVQVRGGLGFVLSKLHIDEAPGTEAVDQQPVTLTGNVGLTVFPVSRFPFDGSYEVTDSRTSGDLTSLDYTSKRLSLRQSYATLTGGTTASARYERSVLESESFGRDRLDNIEANISKSAGKHNLQAEGSRAYNQRDQTNETSLIDRISLRDTWRPNNLSSVESLAYVTRTDYDPGDSGLSSATNSDTAQLTSFATWRPAERHPLYVTGSLRAFGVRNEASGVQTEAQSLNASIGANYQYSPVLRFLASASATGSETDTSSVVTTTQSAGVSYTPAFLPLGKFQFSWNASGNVANQTVSSEGSRQALSGGVGYNLMRGFATGAQSQANLNIGQALGGVHDTEGGEQLTLTSSVSLSWSRSASAGTAEYASLTASDSRSVGDTNNAFQLINLQATRQSLLSRVSSWSGNITVQAARQHTETDLDFTDPGLAPQQTDTQTLSYSINLSYQHMRAFGVRNLRFTALATANSQVLNSRQEGDIDAPPEAIDNSLELRFDYFIGRLQMRLSARTAEIAQQRQNQVLFRITRFFGSP